MNFSDALQDLKNTHRIWRKGWNGKGMYLILFSPVAENLEILSVYNVKYPLAPFIIMKTADNMHVPWLASQTDILANDWESSKL